MDAGRPAGRVGSRALAQWHVSARSNEPLVHSFPRSLPLPLMPLPTSRSLGHTPGRQRKSLICPTARPTTRRAPPPRISPSHPTQHPTSRPAGSPAQRECNATRARALWNTRFQGLSVTARARAYVSRSGHRGGREVCSACAAGGCAARVRVPRSFLAHLERKRSACLPARIDRSPVAGLALADRKECRPRRTTPTQLRHLSVS